jgi:hypothetical protein
MKTSIVNGSEIALSEFFPFNVMPDRIGHHLRIEDQHGTLLLSIMRGNTVVSRYRMDPTFGSIELASNGQKSFVIDESTVHILRNLLGHNRIVPSPVLEPTADNPSGVYYQIMTQTGLKTAVPGDCISVDANFEIDVIKQEKAQHE